MLLRKYTKNIHRFLLIMVLFAIVMSPFIVSGEGTGKTVYVIMIDGEITPAMASFLENSLEKAITENADAIVIEIRTLGGRVDSAINMRDAIIASPVPVTVYVESRAISAGALITIAADTIVMAPGSHMGSAKPIPDDPKTVSFVSGEFRTTAERTGRDTEIAMAMVDETIEIEGLVGRGQILDLTANEALEFGYADHIAMGREQVLDAIGFSGAIVVEEEPDFRYRIAQFLTSYEVASLLLTLGMLALVAEFYTQGFGISGMIGVACFVLYFSSGFIAGYTELWSVVIFIVGVILLVIELTMPGFGVFGISGLATMFVGIIFAAPSVGRGVVSLIIALVATIVAIPVFIKLFGKTRLFQRFVLADSETPDRGYVHSPNKTYLVGKTGTTHTPLRPVGSVIIDGVKTDAIAEGEFIDGKVKIKVVRVEGTKVVVAPE